MHQRNNQGTLLDTCAVVNLYATRWMPDILAAVDGPVAIADIVAREAQFVLRGGTGEDAREREPIDLRPLIDAGLLQVIASDLEEELLTYIDLTLDIHPGEAMTGALAIHRGCVVAIDDRKASRVLAARGVALRTSLDVIRAWAEGAGISPRSLRNALVDVRQRGNYEPRRSHPLRTWWNDVLDSP